MQNSAEFYCCLYAKIDLFVIFVAAIWNRKCFWGTLVHPVQSTFTFFTFCYDNRCKQFRSNRSECATPKKPNFWRSSYTECKLAVKNKNPCDSILPMPVHFAKQSFKKVQIYGIKNIEYTLKETKKACSD